MTRHFDIQDLRAGKLPEPPVSVKESHWYAIIIEHGCVLCGAGGRQQRVRMPGEPPDDPGDRYAYDNHDWACSAHFM